MGKAIYLNVDNRNVLSTSVTYDDLVWLYWDFKNKHGKLPTTNDGKAKFNMPQQRIIKRVLEENKITFNDFMLQFGKVKHVRTESDNYELFVKRYKDVSNKSGFGLSQKDLCNNEYGLPSSSWFVKYCPDKNVKSFDDFVIWCGYDSNKLKKDDELVAQKLIQLEKDLERPITKEDITIDNVGFSNIVVTRIWGNLNNAKRKLGLSKTVQDNSKPFSYYEEKLLNTLNKVALDKDRKFITWADIENNKYDENPSEHKTYLRAFKKQGLDFFEYLKSIGYEMNKSKSGYRHTFDDGERTVSTYEYDFSKFVKDELKLEYKKDYDRDVLYKTFANISTKINCDYVFYFIGMTIYVEIAGIIYNSKNDNWRDVKYSTKMENEYRNKLTFKEDLLLKNNKSFLFLFPSDMLNGTYKEKFKKFIQTTNTKEVA